MRIYLAARYSRRDELIAYRNQLVDLGHVVTSRWLNGDHQLDGRNLSVRAADHERERFALEDWRDVTAAELTISFTEAERSTPGRGGRHVEFGVAIATGQEVWIVGPRENVFHHLPRVRQFDIWHGALQALIEEQAKP